MTGSRNETTFVGKSEKARVEPNQVAFVFRYCGREIIEPQLASAATKRCESVDVASHEGFETSGCG